MDEHTYYLDLSTLLTRLAQQRATLTTALPGERIGIVQVEQGKIVACTIWSTGQTLEGAPAYELLRRASVWQLSLDSESPAPTPVAAPTEPIPAPVAAAPSHAIPTRQQATLTPELVAALSPKERLIMKMVFLLVDGRRSVQEIHAQLQLSSHTIQAALETLISFGVIVYKK